MERERHWSDVYAGKPADQLSWYTEHLVRSLRLVTAVCSHEGAVIDVGAGASTLVDDLISAGYRNLTVLDISKPAIETARARLGANADAVHWIVGDLLSADLPADHYDVWHDRATFHFLTDAGDRRAYATHVQRSVKPGGHLVIATFAPDGPTRCSGLAICRYDGTSLAREFPTFELIREELESHRTPAGIEQRFAYSVLRKR